MFHQHYRAIELYRNGDRSLDQLQAVFPHINSHRQTDHFSFFTYQADIIASGVSPLDEVSILVSGSPEELIYGSFDMVVVRDMDPRLAQIPSIFCQIFRDAISVLRAPLTGRQHDTELPISHGLPRFLSSLQSIILPGQQLVDPIDLVINNAAYEISEPSPGINAIRLGGFGRHVYEGS